MTQLNSRPAQKPEIVLIRVSGPQPSDAFIKWIESYGVSPLARRLGVDRLTVQTWKRRVGTYRAPRLQQARLLIALSYDLQVLTEAQPRPLTYDDIYGPVIPEIERR